MSSCVRKKRGREVSADISSTGKLQETCMGWAYTSRSNHQIVLRSHSPYSLHNFFLVIGDHLNPFEVNSQFKKISREEIGVGIFCLPCKAGGSGSPIRCRACTGKHSPSPSIAETRNRHLPLRTSSPIIKQAAVLTCAFCISQVRSKIRNGHDGRGGVRLTFESGVGTGDRGNLGSGVAAIWGEAVVAIEREIRVRRRRACMGCSQKEIGLVNRIHRDRNLSSGRPASTHPKPTVTRSEARILETARAVSFEQFQHGVLNQTK